MSPSNNNDWGNKPLIVIIGLVGSIIAILVFFSGKESIQEFLFSPTSTNTLNLSLPKCPADPAPTRYVTETPLPTSTPLPSATPPPPGSLRPAEVGEMPSAVTMSGCSDALSVQASMHFTQPTSDEMQSLPLLQASESCAQTKPSSVTHRITAPINSTHLWRFQSCSSNGVLPSNVIFLRSGAYGFCEITEYFVDAEYNSGANHCKTWTTKLTLTQDIVLSVQYSFISDSYEAGADFWFSPGIYEQRFLVTIK